MLKSSKTKANSAAPEPKAVSIKKSLTNQLIDFAEVPEHGRNYFKKLIDQAMREARRNTPARPISSTKITKTLRSIAEVAKALHTKLKELDHRAVLFLDARISSDSTEQYVDRLAALLKAAELAEKDARRTLGAKGRRGGIRTPFDVFVWQLLSAARECGGELTIYKSVYSNSGWDGSLLRAICSLQAELPSGFLPKQNSLGSALDQIAKVHGR